MSVLQCYDIKQGFAYFTYLFTRPEFRSKGYSALLLRAVTFQKLSVPHKRCGLFTNLNNIAVNYAVVNAGYQLVNEWTKVFIKP